MLDVLLLLAFVINPNIAFIVLVITGYSVIKILTIKE